MILGYDSRATEAILIWPLNQTCEFQPLTLFFHFLLRLDGQVLAHCDWDWQKLLHVELIFIFCVKIIKKLTVMIFFVPCIFLTEFGSLLRLEQGLVSLKPLVWRHLLKHKDWLIMGIRGDCIKTYFLSLHRVLWRTWILNDFIRWLRRNFTLSEYRINSSQTAYLSHSF